MFLAPVLASIVFPKGTKEWHNPVMDWLTSGYRFFLNLAMRWKPATLAIALATFAGALLLSGTFGSEFLPHLDEGAIWARGTLAPSTGAGEGTRIMNQARIAFAKFPEVK